AVPTMQRLAAANGLVALVGSETYLIQLKSESEQSSVQQGRLNEVIRTMTQIITFSVAIGLQSNSACLPFIRQQPGGTPVFSSNGVSPPALPSSLVPQDFAYLPENSILRATADFLIQAGKKGPEVCHPALVKAALASLVSAGGSHQYPPVNWSTLLSPLMRLDFNEIQQQCMMLAASQAQSSQSAALFLGTWLSPPLVHCLSHVPEDKLQAYVESLALRRFRVEEEEEGGEEGQGPGGRSLHLRPLRLAVLRGLGGAMSLPNPPKHCWTLLCSAAQEIYASLPGEIRDEDVELYEETARCLSEMSDTEIERIVCVTELMGHIRNVAYGTSSVECADTKQVRPRSQKETVWQYFALESSMRFGKPPPRLPSQWQQSKEATDFLLRVFAGAVVSWGDRATPLLLGVRPTWSLPRLPGPGDAPCGDGRRLAEGWALVPCLDGLAHSLERLLDREPWSGQAQKLRYKG
ncbi:hypothetical protein CRUP_013679, partial [Coryphaenoides rupestris]